VARGLQQPVDTATLCPSCGANGIVASAAAAKRARIKAAPALACSLMLRLVVQSVGECEGEGVMAAALDGATHAGGPAWHMSIAAVSLSYPAMLVRLAAPDGGEAGRRRLHLKASDRIRLHSIPHSMLHSMPSEGIACGCIPPHTGPIASGRTACRRIASEEASP